jgi:hypothetical protein
MSSIAACAAALVAAGALAAGCGGSEAASGATSGGSPKVDIPRARASLIRAGDFPSGWVAGRGSRREPCETGADFQGITAYTTSRSFTQGNVDFQQSVWLFRDAKAAAKAFAQMDAPAGRACFRLRVSARIRDQDSKVIEPLQLSQQQQADGARRGLWLGRISRLVQTPFGVMDTGMQVQVDTVERLSGRGVSTIAVIAAAQRPEASVERSVVEAAKRRLDASLAAPRS